MALTTLSEKLSACRTDRPDEWTMDEFKRDAVKLEAERDEALAKRDKLRKWLSSERRLSRELKKDIDSANEKLAAMESQRFNVKEFIRRCQDQWDFDVKIASEMLEIAKYVPTVPADKSKYKAVTKSDLPLDTSREHLLNEAAKRADYFFRQVDGSYSFPAPDGQVSQIIEMLLAAANMPADKPEVAVPKNFHGAIVVLKENLRDKDRGVKACGIRDNDQVRDALNTLLSDTSHSQQSEQSTSVWESALLDAANAVVHANQNNTGYEPSRSLLACLIDELREILDDANIDFPGDTDRCPSHESEGE